MDEVAVVLHHHVVVTSSLLSTTEAKEHCRRVTYALCEHS